MNDKKINPSHYQLPNGFQVIDLTKHLGFCEGNVVKYVARAGNKGGESRLDDLRKAKYYLDLAVSDEEAKIPERSPFLRSVKQTASEIRQESEKATDITDPEGTRNWGRH